LAAERAEESSSVIASASDNSAPGIPRSLSATDAALTWSN